jgi:hypothetical protein
MKIYEDFQFTEASFEEMIGDPDQFSSAIGSVAVSFAHLEDGISKKISQLLILEDDNIATIVTANLTFRNKLDLLASLIRHRLPRTKFNTGRNNPDGVLNELISVLATCSELRNRIIHSSWEGSFYRDGRIVRKKITARSRKGLRIQTEELDPGMIQDLSDYIIYGDYILDEFFLVYEDEHGEKLGA